MKIGREINFQSWTFGDSFFSSNVSPCCIVPWLPCPDLVGHLLVKVEICKTESSCQRKTHSYSSVVANVLHEPNWWKSICPSCFVCTHPSVQKILDVFIAAFYWSLALAMSQCSVLMLNSSSILWTITFTNSLPLSLCNIAGAPTMHWNI